MKQIIKKILRVMAGLFYFYGSVVRAEPSEKSTDAPSFQAFQLGIVNNSSHFLTFQGVSGVMTVCDTLENKKTINPGDGLVLTENMVNGASYMNCLYTFTTENGLAVTLQITNPTYRYFRKASYEFFDHRLRPLSTLSTPENNQALPQSLMHKSAVVTLNYF